MDCGASMHVEGQEGLPCSMKRFSSWAGKVLRADGGGLHLAEFETQWRDKALLWSSAVAVIVGFYFLAKFIGRLVDKEIAEKEEQEGMRRKDIEEETLDRKEA